MNQNDDNSFFSCYRWFTRAAKASKEDINKAISILEQSGLIKTEYPSAFQATAFLNTLPKETAQGTGFLRRSNTCRHHLALSFVNQDGKIQHHDLSEQLEQHLVFILSKEKELASLKAWGEKQCKSIMPILELLTSNTTSLIETEPDVFNILMS